MRDKRALRAAGSVFFFHARRSQRGEEGPPRKSHRPIAIGEHSRPRSYIQHLMPSIETREEGERGSKAAEARA
jgi:hypothetical protein